MQRLNHPAPLVPSSMSTGNTISDDAALAQTAPGSASVNPLPDRLDRLPMPELPGEQLAVGYPGASYQPPAEDPGWQPKGFGRAGDSAGGFGQSPFEQQTRYGNESEG